MRLMAKSRFHTMIPPTRTIPWLLRDPSRIINYLISSSSSSKVMKIISRPTRSIMERRPKVDRRIKNIIKRATAPTNPVAATNMQKKSNMQ